MLSSKKRLTWILGLLLLAGFVCTSLISYWVARTALGDQISQTTLPLTSDNVYSEIQRDLLRPVFISSLMARNTFLRDWILAGESDEQDVRRYLSEIQQRFQTVSSFLVTEGSRRYYHPSGELKTVSADDPSDAWYFRTLQLPSGQDYEINVDWDTANPSELTVFVNHKVFDFAGEPIGVTGVGLALDTVTQLLMNYEKRYGRRVYFVDEGGVITLNGQGALTGESLYKDEAMAVIAESLLGQRDGSFRIRRDGVTVHINSRYVPEFKWILIVEQREHAASDSHQFHALLINLLISVLLTVLVLVSVNLAIGFHQRRLETMASTDKLTGALSRQVFDGIHDHASKVAKRTGKPISLLIMDLDRFKPLNDRHGHLVGDECLRWLVRQTRKVVREVDSICRWGGDEFLILLPDCDGRQAEQLAGRIKCALTDHPLVWGEESISLSVSTGTAQWAEGEDFETVLGRADETLMQNKRNRV
ncbi:MAG: sensor domain-containing diguanylate cyclase [Gammaproteobacteria bacterium]